MSNQETSYAANHRKVIAYVRANHTYINQRFKQLTSNDSQSIKVQKVFEYIKQAFSLQNFQFRESKDGSNFFQEENIEKMEKLLERFYTEYKKIPKQKFFFYRMTITQEEVADLIQFWIKSEENLYVHYDPQENKQTNITNVIQNTETNININNINQDKLEEKSIKGRQPSRYQNYRKEKLNIAILSKQSLRKKKQQPQNIISSPLINNQQNVGQLKNKKSIYVQEINSPKFNKIPSQYEILSSSSMIRSGSLKSMDLRDVNIRILFDFYSKQNHITGVYSTFQRIQQQSNHLNYAQFIYFIKDFNLQPNSKENAINLYNMFQKAASNYKSLEYKQFQNLLKSLSHKLIELDVSDIQKQQIFFAQIFKENLNSKIHFRQKKHMGKPFHIIQSNDFRIKPAQIKYNFQLSPHSGKLSQQIQIQLLKRKEIKQQLKEESNKKKQIIKQKFLKKLSYIDPFNSKLAQLKRDDSPKQELVGINNLEAYRDVSFNAKQFFKIDQKQDQFLNGYILQKPGEMSNGENNIKKVDANIEQPKKQYKSNQYLTPPRKMRSDSIAQQAIARVAQIQRLQKQKNSSLIKNIIQQNKKKVHQGMEALDRSRKI